MESTLHVQQNPPHSAGGSACCFISQARDKAYKASSILSVHSRSIRESILHVRLQGSQQNPPHSVSSSMYGLLWPASESSPPIMSFRYYPVTHSPPPSLPLGPTPRGQWPPGATCSVAATGFLLPLEPQAPLPGGYPAGWASCLAAQIVPWSQGRSGMTREDRKDLRSCGDCTHAYSLWAAAASLKDYWYTKTDTSGPWPSGHAGPVLPRSATSLFTEHEVRGHARVGQESLTEPVLLVNFPTESHFPWFGCMYFPKIITAAV